MTCLLPGQPLQRGDTMIPTVSYVTDSTMTDQLTYCFPFGYQNDRESDFSSLFFTVTIKLQKLKKVKIEVLFVFMLYSLYV